MNEIKIDVNFENGTCDISGINLISGDYNSTKCIFTFDKENGTKIFKMKNPNDETVFEREIINNEIILTGYDENDEEASLFNSAGDYLFEINLYDNDGRLSSTKGVISVEEELVKEDDKEIEVYKPLFDQLLGQLDNAITEVENLDIDAEKVENTATITITKKDGSTKEVEIHDGQKGETGDRGADGVDGTTPNVQIGTTTTLPAGSNATVTQRGTLENPIFDFGIPKGADGEGKVTSVNGQIGDVVIDIPDVSNFITKSVDDLVNYYKKSETYTQTEVNNLIGAIQQFHYEIVSTLPATGATNILYLVPKTTTETTNYYDEYVYANNSWEKIGDTQIDLSDYVTNTDLNNALANYTTTANLTTLLNAKQDNLVSGTNIKTINNESILGSGNIEVASSIDIDETSITLNNNDELQAEGVIDQNTANTNKMWTGTLAQYNALVTKDSDTYYYIIDDVDTINIRTNVEVVTSQDTTYTINILTANKSYKLGELTSLTITVCEMFDEETVIYFTSGTTATVLNLPNDVTQIGDTIIKANKSYIIAIINKIAVIKEY